MNLSIQKCTENKFNAEPFYYQFTIEEFALV